jgi:hypothetical protein
MVGVELDEEAQGRICVGGSLRHVRRVLVDDVRALTATLEPEPAQYGQAYHVTFPGEDGLDLWVSAVLQAWYEVRAARKKLAMESGGTPDYRHRLIVVVQGVLRCGSAIPPSDVRPATVLAELVQFPNLDPALLERAEALYAYSTAPDDDEQVEIDVCLSCLLPDCNPHARCALRQNKARPGRK